MESPVTEQTRFTGNDEDLNQLNGQSETKKQYGKLSNAIQAHLESEQIFKMFSYRLISEEQFIEQTKNRLLILIKEL